MVNSSVWRITATAALMCGLAGGDSRADDWPQWMGPNRNSVWAETGIVQSIPDGGLPVTWRTPIRGGYSGPSVADGRVFVTDYVRKSGDTSNDPGRRNELQGTERLVCLDAATGKEFWVYSYDCPYQLSYPSGPRVTPTVAGDKVYHLGAEGHFACVDVKTGKAAWKLELKPAYKVGSPIWGFSGAPLVDGGLVYVIVGGEGSGIVAFDRMTGQERWKALSSGDAGYAPPTLIEAGGVRQLIVWLPDAISSLNPSTGLVYWTQPLKPDYGMSIMAPRQSGNLLFASGIGSVGAAFELASDKPAAKLAWKGSNKSALYAANATPFIDSGVIYGCDCQPGAFRAVKLDSGERLWESFAPTTGNRRGAHGTAFVVKNGDQFVLFSETGDLIMAKLSPEKYTELGRMRVVAPTSECFGREVVWSHPAFAMRSAFIRNDQEIVRVNMAAK